MTAPTPPTYSAAQVEAAETAWRLILEASRRLSPLVHAVAAADHDSMSPQLLQLIVTTTGDSHAVLWRFWVDDTVALSNPVEEQIMDAISEILSIASIAETLRRPPEALTGSQILKDLRDAMLSNLYALERRVGVDWSFADPDRPRQWLGITSAAA